MMMNKVFSISLDVCSTHNYNGQLVSRSGEVNTVYNWVRAFLENVKCIPCFRKWVKLHKNRQ